MLHMVDRAMSSRGSKDEGAGARGKLGTDKAEDEGKRDGEVTLSGSMTRQTEQDMPVQDQTSHITNTGKMIEEMEIKMRNLLQQVRASCIPLLSNAHLTDLHARHRCTLAKREASS